jgi:hypothetical protein
MLHEPSIEISELTKRLSTLLQLVHKKDGQISQQQQAIDSLEATLQNLVQTTDQLCGEQSRPDESLRGEYQEELDAAVTRMQREHKELMANEAMLTQQKIDEAVGNSIRERKIEEQRMVLDLEEKHNLALLQSARKQKHTNSESDRRCRDILRAREYSVPFKVRARWFHKVLWKRFGIRIFSRWFVKWKCATAEHRWNSTHPIPRHIVLRVAFERLLVRAGFRKWSFIATRRTEAAKQLAFKQKADEQTLLLHLAAARLMRSWISQRIWQRRVFQAWQQWRECVHRGKQIQLREQMDVDHALQESHLGEIQVSGMRLARNVF